ncbi:MAG: TIGR01777 family oxidoreductase [Draconibacterium sp.]|nr:TIGR01777 family oxidoreductase [Draconibacterium sp.]
MTSIKITGINGYLGTIISKQLIQRGYNVSGISRKLLYGNAHGLKNQLKGCDVIINMAGASILQRWTQKNRKTIYDSRVETTKNLVKAIHLLPIKDQPKKFISASAIGIYELGKAHNESSTKYETDFVGKVVKDWEDTLNELPESIQKTIFRIGLVLGKEAKTIKNLLPFFKLGLGGPIGLGNQAFPFVHEKDLTNAFIWAVEDSKRNDTFNLVAPEKITNADFTLTLAKKLKIPAFIPVPGFVLRLVFGEAATLLLKSPTVEPKALIDSGFNFEYPTIDSALTEILA